MTTNRLVRISAVLPCLCALMLLVPYLMHETDESMVLLGSLFIFMLWGFGVFIGMLISAIVRRPRMEPWFYLGGQLIIIVAVAGFITVNVYDGWQREKNFGNVEDNERYIKYTVDDEDRDVVRIAYKALAGKYPVNHFELYGHHVRLKDSTANGLYQPLFMVQLSYKKKQDRGLYKAEVVIRNHSTDFRYYDRYYTAEELHTRDSSIREVKKVIRDAMKNAPDSMREKMQEDFPEVFED